jgi:hypothetical protein
VAGKGLTHCWGEPLDQAAVGHTTFNARTYLQPQLNKAIGREAIHEPRNQNLKDHMLVSAGRRFENTQKDNTGQGPGNYKEDLVFPSLEFPSDHGIIISTLRC